MGFYDIFNGDADGLCALHQLRLAEPREATLVTGAKREVDLLRRVTPVRGDAVTVLDISLDTNRSSLLAMLEIGVSVRYFDHHFSGGIPRHPLLEAHIDTASETCTSLIVDRFLGGRHRAWAVVAAFGDNLHESAAAAGRGLSPPDLARLQELGECLNYNAYGDDPSDLHFHPAALYRRIQPYADPLQFCEQAPELDTLRRAYRDDMALARAAPVEQVGSRCFAVFLPDAPWSRRTVGMLANELAREHAQSGVALLVRRREGYRVSLRAPGTNGADAHRVARAFETGNGRARAAGIQFLPQEELPRLMQRLRETFGDDRPEKRSG
jgi:hypothetical protein